MATLAWRIPWTEEPGGLLSMGLQSRTRLKRLSSSSSSCSYILILQFLSYKMMSIMNRSFYFLLNNITYIKTSMFVPQLISVCFSFNFCVYIKHLSMRSKR